LRNLKGNQKSKTYIFPFFLFFMAVIVTTSGTVSEGTGTVGTRILDKKYPYEEGLIAGSTKQTGDPNL
jgi:hypothetical protein